MSKRIIKKLEFVTVRFDNEWNEYEIRPNKDTDSTRSGFDTDKESALQTAQVMDADFRTGKYPY